MSAAALAERRAVLYLPGPAERLRRGVERLTLVASPAPAIDAEALLCSVPWDAASPTLRAAAAHGLSGGVRVSVAAGGAHIEVRAVSLPSRPYEEPGEDAQPGRAGAGWDYWPGE